MIVVDFCERAPPHGAEAWQGRLLGLARQHASRVLLLTEKPTTADSLGALVQGRKADLIVLSRDPTVDIANLRTVEQVMVRGHLMSADSLRRHW